MAGPLYARYVPPKPQTENGAHPSDKIAASNPDGPRSDLNRKRKRVDEKRATLGKDNRKSKPRQKRDNFHQSEDTSRAHQPSQPNHFSEQPDISDKEHNEKKHDRNDRKHRTHQATGGETQSHTPEGDSSNHVHKSRASLIDHGDQPEQGPNTDSRQRKEKKKKHKRIAKPNDNSTISTDGGDQQVNQSKHTSVLSKFEQSMKNQPTELDPETQPEEVDVNDIVPIPLPVPAPNANTVDSISVLPPWLSNPITIPPNKRLSFRELPLDPNLAEKLQQKGFSDCLPIQSGLLPLLLPSQSQHPGDLCVSAATGSGKTLGYVLPIVQSLSTDVNTRLRALIVVPTRELVNQVRDAAEICAAGTSLRIGVAVGSKALAAEQSALVETLRKYDPKAYRALKQKLERKIAPETDEEDNDEDDDDKGISFSQEYLNLLPNFVPDHASKVDILIATPGRLVEHIKATKGFSLQDLKWLVIDEADRLLDSSFQEWVETLFAAINQPDSTQVEASSCLSFWNFGRRRNIRKVVLSATMTRDLDKLGALRLNNPRMILLEGEQDQSRAPEERNPTELPPTLDQFGVPVGDGSEKPLYLLALLSHITQSDWPEGSKSVKSKSNSAVAISEQSSSSGEDMSASSDANDETSNAGEPETNGPTTERGRTSWNALIFTSSNEATHRLAQLIVRLSPEYETQLATVTKSSDSKRTRKTLSAFRSSKLRILIATDLASRGIDLPNLEHVINYDIPHSVTSYVHRVGRTARAGRKGVAWTLIQDREAAWFWKELAKGDQIRMTNGGIVRKRYDLAVIKPSIKEEYVHALAELEKQVKGEMK